MKSARWWKEDVRDDVVKKTKAQKKEGGRLGGAAWLLLGLFLRRGLQRLR